MKKVVIIGAGPAGLTAGYELLKQSKDYEVTIIEASDCVGGIARTVNHNGNRMDIGGHRFFSKYSKVNRWWDEMLPRQGELSYDDKILGRTDVPLMSAGPDPYMTDEVMLNRRRVSRIYYDGKFIDYPIKMNSQTFKSLGLGETWKAGFSYLGGNIIKRRENNLEDFYINRFGKKLYSMFFEGYTQKLWGRHPKAIAPDWGAQRVQGLSIGTIIKDVKNKALKKNNEDVETSLIERFTYPKLGPGQLWEKTARLFQEMGGTLYLNCPVNSVKTEGDKVKSVGCMVNGEEVFVEADIIISSMAIKDLISGMNDVPRHVAEVAYGLPYRDFVTVGLLVPKLNLINNTGYPTLGNVIPDCWIYVQDTKIKLGRIQIFNNWSPYLVEDPENTVWLGLEYFCNEGDFYWNQTNEQWLEQAVNDLSAMKIITPNTKILDYNKVAIKKAYPAYFDTYKDIDDVIAYLNKFTNLYCIGRNGQHRYNNMDHSMMTAFETVECIIKNKTDKSAIWNVNTEQEYHETKKANVNTALLSDDSDKKVPPVKAVPEKKEPVASVGVVPTAPVSAAPRPVQRNISAPVEEEAPKPLPRRIRRYPISASGSHTPSVFAADSQAVTVPQNVAEARDEYLAENDPVTQRSIVKKASPTLNESAENYGVLQDASAASLIIEKSGRIDKTEEEIANEQAAFANAQETVASYEELDEAKILRSQEMFTIPEPAVSMEPQNAAPAETPLIPIVEEDIPQETAETSTPVISQFGTGLPSETDKNEDYKKEWEARIEENRKQEERNAEIKNIIANGRVIKSTTVTSAPVKKGSSKKKVLEEKEVSGKVIAVIKDGVTVPVSELEAIEKEMSVQPVAEEVTVAPKKRGRKPKAESDNVILESKDGFIDNPIVKEITIVTDDSLVEPPKKRGRKKKVVEGEEIIASEQISDN